MQIAVGPLPNPTSYAPLPVNAKGATDVSWLQRPNLLPDIDTIRNIVENASVTLRPLMQHAFTGFTYGDDCGDKCLFLQFGEFIGRGDGKASSGAGTQATSADAGSTGGAAAPAAGGRKMLQEQPTPTTASAISDIKRGTFVFFQRDMEGHHLWTVGLQMLLDLSSLNPEDWGVVSVYFAEMMFDSLDQLMGVFDGTMLGPDGQNVTEKVRSYQLHMPGKY